MKRLLLAGAFVLFVLPAWANDITWGDTDRFVTRECKYDIYIDAYNYARLCRDRNGAEWSSWHNEYAGVVTQLQVDQLAGRVPVGLEKDK